MHWLFFVLFTFFASHCASIQTVLEREKVAEGIFYEKIKTNKNQIVHVTIMDPKYTELKLIEAKGETSLQTVSDLAALYSAPIAVNGGFFKADGKAAGALKIDGKWISSPSKNRGFIGWHNTKNIPNIFGRSADPQATKVQCEEYDNVLGGIPLLLINGKKVSVAEEKALSDFLINRYARTAICTDINDFIKIVVFEGGDRRTHALGLKQGANIDELSDFLLEIDCLSALNLDGGYSSALVKNGLKVNSYALPFWPERSVGNALLIFSK
jgi:exopolysaccharide biosynthesis protein